MSTETKFTAVMSGDLEQVRQHGAPIEVVGDIARAMPCAPPGSRQLVADFRGIESVVTAWNPGQQDKVEQWAKFFRTQDPHDDPYYLLGRSLGFPEDTARAKGKIADLAFGYQGGAGAYKNFAPADDTATDAQIEGFKLAWRNRHPQIVQSWYGTDRAAIAAVSRPGDCIHYGRLHFQCKQISDATFLFITLPSGRRLAYPFPKLITNRFDKPAVEFQDNSLTNGGWVPCNHGHGSYGGLWTENIVSGIARDLLAAAMTRREAAGYPVVLHVHDEIVCELPEREGSLEEFKYLIERPPDWAEGLPIAAKVRNGPRWAEADVPVVRVPGAFELPPLKPKQKPAARPVDTSPIVAGPPITDIGFDAADPRGRLVAFVIEREKIRKRKEAGEPRPWTLEPILANPKKRFCNVHRENDRGTRWTAANIVEPYRNHPDLGFAIAAFRWCGNEPAAWGELLPFLLPTFDAEGFRRKAKALMDDGQVIHRMKAYKPVLPPRELKGIGLVDFHTDYILGPLWRDREQLRPRPDDTLGAFSARLEQCYRIGGFFAGQVVADLKHAQLKEAADWSTYARSGPGSRRGLNRARGQPIDASWSEAKWYRELLALQAEIAPLLSSAGVPPLDAQNLQNCLCEWDKWERERDKGDKPADEPPPKPTEHLAESDSVEANAPVAVTTLSAELDALILEDIAQRESVEAQPAAANGGSKSESERDRYAEDHAGEPFNDGDLLRRGYQFVRSFDYTLPDGTLLCEQRRYELRADIPVIKGRPRKQFRPRRPVGKDWVTGAGERRVIYNWPALMRAGPGSTVTVTEGESNAEALIKAGLLTTTVLSHKWAPECVAALTGCHLNILADHDKDGEKLANDAQRKLAPVAASTRIVPAPRLWKHLPGAPEPAPGDDVEDWLARGGDPQTLLDICSKIPTKGTEIEAWNAGELLGGTEPEPRQWLTAGMFCRTFLSGLVAPGDAGKTTLRLTQAIELATGRELLGRHIYLRARVLVLCLEDDKRELHRRLKAICKHYAINPAELDGWLFCDNIKKTKLAERDAKGRPIPGPLDAMLRRAIERYRCDLVILDPFVKLHALAENVNEDMDFVCELLIDIAQSYNIAIDSPAHTHKGAITAGDADARRGASAQRDAGRLDYTLTVMSEVEATQFGIAPDDRKSYVRLDKAKANIVRAMKAVWLRLVSVPLNNATALYPEGDEVQAIERWAPPETWAGMDGETLNTILNEIDAGMPNGQRYSKQKNVADRAAWRVVHQHCPDKAKAQCREIIKQWSDAGVLVESDYDDPKSRKSRRGLFVNASKRPQY